MGAWMLMLIDSFVQEKFLPMFGLVHNFSCKQHLPWIFNVFLDLDQKRHSFPSVEQSMVVR